MMHRNNTLPAPLSKETVRNPCNNQAGSFISLYLLPKSIDPSHLPLYRKLSYTISDVPHHISVFSIATPISFIFQTCTTRRTMRCLSLMSHGQPAASSTPRSVLLIVNQILLPRSKRQSCSLNKTKMISLST